MRTLHTAAWLAVAFAGASCDGLLDPSQDGNLVPKTVDEDAALSSISFAGSRFHFETFGDPSRPAIVFLHGGPGMDYREMLRMKDAHDGYALADDHYLVFWDQRGTGLSRRHDCRDFTFDVIDRDLDTLVDMVSPGRPVILIGHSWGGMYATMYINNHPDKVAAAALIEPGPLTGALFESVKADMFDMDFFSEWLNDYAWDDRFISPDDHARADYHRLVAMRDSQPRYHQPVTDPAPVWRMGAVASRCVQNAGMKDGKMVYDFTNHLAAYTKPVLFMAGALSEVQGAALQERQRALYPSSSLVVIPDAGHEVDWTHPAETVAAIHAYLGTVQ